MLKAVRTIISNEVARSMESSYTSIFEAKESVRAKVLDGIVELVKETPNLLAEVGAITLDEITKEVDWAFIDAINSHSATGGKTYIKANKITADAA